MILNILCTTIISSLIVLSSISPHETRANSQVQKQELVGSWEIENIEHLNPFDEKRNLKNTMFFGSAVWENSMGKKFVFTLENQVHTDIVKFNENEVTLLYKYQENGSLTFFLDSTHLDRSFTAQTHIKADKMTWIIDDDLKVTLSSKND